MFRLFLIAIIFSLGVCAPIDDNDRRILGPTLPGQMRQFQYMASLRRTGTNQPHLAGGVLISSAWVLSAASVASLFIGQVNQLQVALGVITVPAIVAPGFTNTAQQIEINNDVALVRIPVITCNAARFGFISPIYMDHIPANNTLDALVAGWGFTDTGATTQLRFREVSTIDDPACPFDTSLCTTGVLCPVDVGGPLVTKAGLIGIATTATCGGMDVYTRISVIRLWINVITGV